MANRPLHLSGWFWWIAFWMITLIIYWGSEEWMFLDDFLSGIVAFKNEGWNGFANSYGFTSMYYGHNLVFFGFYSIFGLNEWAWHLLYTGLHAANACLLMLLLSKFFNRLSIHRAHRIALTGSLLFLVSTYNTENVVWGATPHYLVSMICLLWGLNLYAGYLEKGGRWQWFTSLGLFAFSLVTLEMTLVFPAIFGLLFGWLWPGKLEWSSIKQTLLKLTLPQSLLIIIYFLLTKEVKGHWIGHYGDMHTDNWSYPYLLTTTLQHITKTSFLVHYWPNELKGDWYAWMAHWKKASLVLGVLIAGLSVLYKIGWKRTELKTSFIFAICGLLVLLPFMNMYFTHIHMVENDRFEYFLSLFLFPIIALGLAQLHRYMWLGMVVSYTLLHIGLLRQTLTYWEGANQVQSAAVESYRWENSPKVFVLNMPANFEGCYIFRSSYRFNNAMRVFRDKDILKNYETIAAMNFQSVTDSVKVEQLDSVTYHVVLARTGGWFWYEGLGATDRETDEYTVDFDEWNTGYTLRFKKYQSDPTLIYYANGWQEAKKETRIQ